MRKCPYCAEEILEDAVICRYCHRRVKKSWGKIAFIILLVLVIAVLAIVNHKTIKESVWNLKRFLTDIRDIWRLLKDIIRDMRDGITSLKEHRDTIQKIYIQ